MESGESEEEAFSDESLAGFRSLKHGPSNLIAQTYYEDKDTWSVDTKDFDELSSTNLTNEVEKTSSNINPLPPNGEEMCKSNECTGKMNPGAT